MLFKTVPELDYPQFRPEEALAAVATGAAESRGLM